jgi:DNA repair exonuclease SbcCD ATPase subunit
MGILGALTHSNTQVGIISHVEWLQEGALPRICVEPIGMGRSKIRVEGV